MKADSIIKEEVRVEVTEPIKKESVWKQFLGREILPVDDFVAITGVDICKHKAFFREENFKGGADYNGYGFKNGDVLMYFYPSGVKKAIWILEQDKKIQMNSEAKELLDRVESKKQPPKELAPIQTKEPLKITIILDREFLNDCVTGKVGL